MFQSLPIFNRLQHLPSSSRRGAVLLEALMAMVIVAVFLTGEYAASSRVWSLVRSSLEVNAASRVINGRTEQIRAATWTQITSADFLNASVLSVAPDASGELGALNETIDVTAYPTPSPNPPPLQITRNNDTGTVTTVGAGNGTMSAHTSVRVNITESWTAKGGKSRLKQISMIVSNGGVTGRH